MAGETITTREASNRLGISSQRLRQLIASGDVHADRHGHIWAVDPASVNDYERRRRPSAGRSLSPMMAWAALFSEFGTAISDDVVQAFDLHRTERSRLTKLGQRELAGGQSSPSLARFELHFTALGKQRNHGRAQ